MLARFPLLCTLFLVVFASKSEGHEVEQFYAELRENPTALEVLFDVGYALPEMRADPTAPQPSRDWLVSRSPDEFETLRQGSENYLRECLSFSQNGHSLSATYDFTDFSKQRPEFHRSLTGGAYFRIIITPIPLIETQPLSCHLSPGDRPNLVIKVPTPDQSESKYHTLKPGEAFDIGSDEGHSFFYHAWHSGFTHVLPLGLDHLCFILGLFLFQRKLRPLLWQSLAFTVAHTVTLGLSAAQLIPTPPSWIEIIIPLSIAAVALENLRATPRLKGRLVLVFFFGLIHGLGFASALQKLFPQDDTFLPFLLITNLGIECAQVVVLLAAWLITIPLAKSSKYPAFQKATNLALLIFALLWTVQRSMPVI